MGLSYTLEELQDFIDRYQAAETGAVEQVATLRWWQLGWVTQIALGSNKWKLTDLGRQHIKALPN